MSHALRVLIDARMLIGRFSGVARVVTKLADELARRDDVRVIALLGHRPYAPWQHRRHIEVIQCSFAAEDRTPYRRWRWEQANLPDLIHQAKADVYHATWNSGIPKNAGVPCVLTIHDLIPWDAPESNFAGMVEAWWYRHAVRTSARRAACITTVSEYVRSVVRERLGVPAEKVVCVPNGVDLPAGQPRASTESPYVLYVGGHEQRKNLAGLFATMRCYWERYGTELELRLTGRAATLAPDAGRELLRLPFAAPVRFLGEIDDRELERHYRSAVALLLLSHAEGFGLPALEAMAHGCPVIVAARGSLPEVVGEAGILVDPDAPAQASNAIFSLVGPSAFRESLIEGGLLRAATMTWAHAADRMLSVYRGAITPVATAGVSSAAAVARAAGNAAATLVPETTSSR